MTYDRFATALTTPVRSTEIVPDATPSLMLQEGRVGVWHGARARGETGVEAMSGCLAFSVFEIPAVPDFSSHRYPDLAQLDEAQRIKRVGERQNQFLAALHSLGEEFAISLRYFYQKPLLGEGKIRLFLIGRSYGHTEQEAVSRIYRFRELVQRSFPVEYPLVDLCQLDEQFNDLILSLDGAASIVEVLKPEQLLPSWHDPAICGFSSYYFPVPFSAYDNDMIGFCQSLINDQHCQRVVADVCLIPTTPFTEVERAEIGMWIQICERWSRDQRLRVGGGLFSEPTTVEIAADPHAQVARKALTELLQRYGNAQTPLFIYAFRIISWDDEPPHGIASTLASFAVAPGSGYQLCAVSRHDHAFQRALNAARYCYVTPAVCNQEIWQRPDTPETVRRLHRMVDVREASGFFRLPIPGREGCPGIPLDTGFVQAQVAAVSRKTIKIGDFVEGRRVTAEEAVLTLNDLTKHCLIVGTPGSGKTTLCFSLLRQLWELHRIPFIVLEPAKTEYRALIGLPCFKDDLLVFTVGQEHIAPFRFNPFVVLEGISVSEHISALNACFSGAFNLWDPLPMILDEAIREVYLDKGWSEYDVAAGDCTREPPCMEDLYHKALEIAERKSYRGEVAGNIRGAIETRIGSLLRGPKGRCFNTKQSVPVQILMTKPVVLELDALNDEEKALVMMFILTMVREYAKSTRKSGVPLTHVVLVEEAHNVIGRGERGHSDQRANPQEVAIRFFVRMLAEIRALGEGIIIADQLPTALAPEAIKSTNVKVMHRVVAADDREELGKAMVFDGGQFQQVAVLPPGQSFVFMEGWPRSRLVQEPNFKEHFGVEVPPDNEAIRRSMTALYEREELRQAYLPYSPCHQICRVCNWRIREQSERIAEKKWSQIKSAIADEEGLGTLTLSTAATYFFADLELPDDRVTRGCISVHFFEKIVRRLNRTHE